MKLTVTGDAEFRAFQLSCRQAADGMEKRMDAGLLQAGEDVARAVHVTTDLYMPSKYEDIFRNRLQTLVEPERVHRSVAIVAWGRGRTGKTRDLPNINRGRLKHPVRGRIRVLTAGGKYVTKPENMRRGVYYNPWTVTVIRAGFFDDPFTFAAPKAVEGRLAQALEDTLEDAAK